MMEKSTPAEVAQREVNFIDYVILPCWSKLHAFLPKASHLVEACNSNRAVWEARVEKLQASSA